MPRMKLATVAMLLLPFTAISPVAAQTIGVFADVAGTDCDLEVPAPGPFTMYVVARLGGPVDGIQGAEFRIDGIQASWFVTWTCPPFECGDFPEPGGPAYGVRMGFPTCKTGQGGVVVLGTLSVFATSPMTNHIVRVLAHTIPANPQFACPNLITCDPPVFTRHCVSGGELIINGPPCTVSVQPEAWSKVKAMYD